MLKDGRLHKEDWKYYLEEKAEWINSQNLKDTAKILELSSEIDKLKEENVALRMVIEELKKWEKKEEKKSEWVSDKEWYIKFSKLLSKDLYDHAKYFYERFVEWEKFVEWKVWYQTEKKKKETGNDQIKEDDVREEVYWWYKFHKDDVDKAEMEFMEDLIREIKEKWLELPF